MIVSVIPVIYIYIYIRRALLTDDHLPIVKRVLKDHNKIFKIFPQKMIWLGRCAKQFCISKQHKLGKSSTFCVQKCIFRWGEDFQGGDLKKYFKFF